MEGKKRIPKSREALIKRVQEYIGDNLETRMTIDSLSEKFHISPTQLKKSFREVTGSSVYAYIRSRRMQEAAVLLKETDQTILDIAGQCGYDNGSKFAKAFRDVTGYSPREFRNHAN